LSDGDLGHFYDCGDTPVSKSSPITTLDGTVVATTEWHEQKTRSWARGIQYFGSTWKVMTPQGELMWSVYNPSDGEDPSLYWLYSADDVAIGCFNRPWLYERDTAIAQFDSPRRTYFGLRRFLDPTGRVQLAVLRCRPTRYLLTLNPETSAVFRKVAITAVFAHWERSSRRLAGFAADF